MASREKIIDRQFGLLCAMENEYSTANEIHKFIVKNIDASSKRYNVYLDLGKLIRCGLVEEERRRINGEACHRVMSYRPTMKGQKLKGLRGKFVKATGDLRP